MFVSEDSLINRIVDTQPEAVILYKPLFGEAGDGKTPVDFELVFCNLAASRLLHAPKSRILGQRLLNLDLLDTDSTRIIFNQCAHVWKTGHQQEYTYYSAFLDGYFNVLRTRLEEGVVSITRDRTKEKIAEEKLREQADLLHSILDSSINAVFACQAIRDLQGTITDFRFLKINRRFTEMIGKTEEAMRNATFLQTFPSAQSLFELNRLVVQSGEPQRHEVNYKGDGLDGWYDVSMVKLGADGLVVSFNDITEGKKDKEAVTASAQYLQNAIDSSQTGITVITPVFDEGGAITDFRYKVINKTFAAYVGGDPGKMTGTLLSEWFPLYKAQGTFYRYEEIFRTGIPQRFDLHYVKDGFDIWVDIMAKKQADEIFVTFHDYTTLKKAQLQQEALVSDLKRSNTNLEDFAYAASHDLQEPLRKIHYFGDKLKNNYQHLYDEEGMNMFLRMEAATQRMRDLINDLLSYSQLGLKERDNEQVDLNKVLQEVISDLEATIQEKNAQITTDLLPVIRGEKAQLRQLFQNLLSNGLKYTHKDRVPFISIHVKEVTGRDAPFLLPAEDRNKAYFLVEVTDNGIGFDQEDAEKIFNVFQRLHGRAEYAGTGVGLAIVKKVIDNHNSYIQASGRPGEGATFRILFPAGE